MNAYFISAALFIFMYLSLVDVFGEKMKSYGTPTSTSLIQKQQTN